MSAIEDWLLILENGFAFDDVVDYFMPPHFDKTSALISAIDGAG
jgi:hypothetical protein